MRLLIIAAGAIFAATLSIAIAADELEPEPYLSATAEPDATKFLPAFPARGSKAKAEDQFVFDSWRRRSTNRRWAQAIADADYHTPVILNGFACAIGAKLDATNAPKLVTLLDRADEDLQAASNSAKDFFHRNRPFVGTKKPTCVPRDSVGESYSYPSGHSALGWTFALILTELAPDRGGEIMARGRSYGESRAVCGMHWESDVEAGRYVGAAVVAALHSDAAFRADMDAARAEVAAARAAGALPGNATCQIRNAADLKRPW